MRLRIVAMGTIQGVGYRALVKNMARNLGIPGSVQNLPSGEVEICCEGPEDALQEFVREIDVRSSKTAPFAVDVRELKVFRLKDTEPDPTHILRPFDILYNGEELRPFEKESLERSEIAILVLSNMHNDLSSKIGNGFQSLSGETKEGFDRLSGEMRDGFDRLSGEMRDGFDRLSGEIRGFR
ncbi:MAG: acylphosphatase, partial [Thermoplasmata archaeon]|nr:acylphosphatase [Thermoplasmata archaeon]